MRFKTNYKWNVSLLLLGQNAALIQKSVRNLRPGDSLQNSVTLMQRRRYVINCWIKPLFLFYFHTKGSRRFLTVILNHWWQVEYSDDAFHTFLDLDSVNYLAVNGTDTRFLVFIQNILNCVPKTNKAFTGLDWHGSKWLMTIFILGWSIPLTKLALHFWTIIAFL